MDWSSTSGNCDSIVDVCDWSIMPGRDGCLLHPDASADYVRTLVLQSQVCTVVIRHIYQIYIRVFSTCETFLSGVAPLPHLVSAALGLKPQS